MPHWSLEALCPDLISSMDDSFAGLTFFAHPVFSLGLHRYPQFQTWPLTGGVNPMDGVGPSLGLSQQRTWRSPPWRSISKKHPSECALIISQAFPKKASALPAQSKKGLRSCTNRHQSWRCFHTEPLGICVSIKSHVAHSSGNFNPGNIGRLRPTCRELDEANLGSKNELEPPLPPVSHGT